MTAGLQIWDKSTGGMVIDLTTQFTNIIGYVDIPEPSIVNGEYNWNYWLSVHVPQFSLGIPFWFTVHNWNINHPDWLANPASWSYPDMFDVSPDTYVEGEYLFYRYTRLSAIPFGDQLGWRWGGHRLWYGVN